MQAPLNLYTIEYFDRWGDRIGKSFTQAYNEAHAIEMISREKYLPLGTQPHEYPVEFLNASNVQKIKVTRGLKV